MNAIFMLITESTDSSSLITNLKRRYFASKINLIDLEGPSSKFVLQQGYNFFQQTYGLKFYTEDYIT